MNEIPLGLLAGFIGIPMVLTVFWLIYVVFRYTEIAESLMPSSSFIEANKNAYSQAGLVGKVFRNGFLTLVLLTPELCAKRGLANLEEVRRFSSSLKRRLMVSWGLCALFFIALIALWLYSRIK